MTFQAHRNDAMPNGDEQGDLGHMKSIVKSAVIMALLSTSGCGALSGASQTADPNANPLVPKENLITRNRTPKAAPLIAAMGEITTERTTGGIILRIEGTVGGPGPYDAALVPQKKARLGDPVLRLDFRARKAPEGRNPIASDSARKVTVAYFVSNQSLRKLNSIEISSAQRMVALGL